MKPDDGASIVVYTHLEQAFGIICACLPACRSLLEFFFPALKFQPEDSPNLRSRYLHGRAASSGGKTPLATRKHSNAQDFVELRDLGSLANVEREDGDKEVEMYEGGGRDHTNTQSVAAGTDMNTDHNDNEMRDENKESLRGAAQRI